MKQRKERMRDGILRRGKTRWAIVVNLGFVTDVNGVRKQKQKWISFEGSYEEAKMRRDELRDSIKKKTFVRPTKLTLRDCISEWLETDIRPPARTGNTYRSFKRLMEMHVYPVLGDIEVQQLDVSDLKRFYALKADAEVPLGRATRILIHDILHSALACAVAEKKIVNNVADVRGARPSQRRATSEVEDMLKRCWTVEEARKVVAAAKTLGSQIAAMIALALDTGMRKGELFGLKWDDIDLDKGRLTVVRQLLNDGPEADPKIAADDRQQWARAMFGVPKGGRSRTLDLADETVELLREHRQQQRLLKMRNKNVYTDFGLVFARELGDKKEAIGRPLRKGNIGRTFSRVIAAAQVRPIVFHGMRHTAASLMFANGESVPVVQHRLGHGSAQITMKIYAHVLPSSAKDAAQRLGKVLHG